MGWGCYRHEVDAGSEHWQKKIESFLTENRHGNHKKPFTWGRDGQVCPFCWEELEKIKNIYQKALGEIQDHPERAGLVVQHAFEDAEAVELHPQETGD
jgi:hypothetical protein